eukprot:1190586-Prorocentrum_minimum.AAC.4
MKSKATAWPMWMWPSLGQKSASQKPSPTSYLSATMASVARAQASVHRATCAEASSTNSARIPALLAKPAAKAAFGLSSKLKGVSQRNTAAFRTWSVATATADAPAKPSYDDFSRLLEKYDFKFNVGDKIVGSVFNIDQRGAYVDIGAKAAAFLPTNEASLAPITKVNLDC